MQEVAVLDDISIQQQAADCKELAHIVGYSNAGLIALQLALDAKSMVHSLALLEPALVGFVSSGREFANQMQIVMSLLQEGNKPKALDTFLSTVFDGSPQYRENN
jgi:pimeloyl-ACP methyl ester carboxylesterase